MACGLCVAHPAKVTCLLAGKGQDVTHWPVNPQTYRHGNTEELQSQARTVSAAQQLRGFQ